MAESEPTIDEVSAPEGQAAPTPTTAGERIDPTELLTKYPGIIRSQIRSVFDATQRTIFGTSAEDVEQDLWLKLQGAIAKTSDVGLVATAAKNTARTQRK